jgi:3,2-trans-enoyl-CoA isomerase
MQTIQLIKKADYAILQLNRGKVNAINHEMVKEIRSTIQMIEQDDSIRGLIIAGKPHFYSAGLDVIELYGYDKEKIATFFKDFGNMYLELARFPKPLVAAITGHSPAGGAVIAITCDHRIMAEGEKYTFGLNEVAVNIQISDDIIKAYAFWLGTGKATKYLLAGKLLSPTEGFAAGIIDEVCPLEEVLERAEKKLKKYLYADDIIFRRTKQKCRKTWLEGLSVNGDQSFDEAVETWWRPDIRARIKFFVESLSKKK